MSKPRKYEYNKDSTHLTPVDHYANRLRILFQKAKDEASFDTREFAHNAVEQFYREHVVPVCYSDFPVSDRLELPVALLPFSQKLLERLDERGIIFVSQLLEQPESAILSWHGVGAVQLDQIASVLEGLGFSIGESAESAE